MLHIPKFWGKLVFLAALTTVFIFIFYTDETREKAWQFIKSELIAENAELKHENEILKHKIATLEKRNLSLKKYLDAYEKNFIALNDAAGNCDQTETERVADLPQGLTRESFEIRQIYRKMLSEKKRWDQYQQTQYKNVLEKTVEPYEIEVQHLVFENEGNREYFLELENALNLHKRLIRDVRLFHDEIQYQERQLQAQRPYQLYDIKFKLAPFARESALVDALQQAMSALSSGIYQTEAEEVLDRIGDALTAPIDQLYEQQQYSSESPIQANYNFNLYSVYGKKLMDYSDTLARQTSITLGPLAFGELDCFNRRLYESLYDLYQAGQDEAIDPSRLDLNELEQVLYSKH